MKDKFYKTKDEDGSITLIRKGSDYDDELDKVTSKRNDSSKAKIILEGDKKMAPARAEGVRNASKFIKKAISHIPTTQKDTKFK